MRRAVGGGAGEGVARETRQKHGVRIGPPGALVQRHSWFDGSGGTGFQPVPWNRTGWKPVPWNRTGFQPVPWNLTGWKPVPPINPCVTKH